ncbi:MAG: hypothetical protein IPM35_28950 [Myxococcales bacterium]|nr:hypothetical protein [Myxococcales bacterium]
MSDDARKAILARRARFVAAALAGASLGAACAKDRGPDPVMCLSPPIEHSDDGGPPPMPCLEPPPPQVCLDPPPPEVCLSPPPPPDETDPSGDYAKPPPGKS